MGGQPHRPVERDRRGVGGVHVQHALGHPGGGQPGESVGGQGPTPPPPVEVRIDPDHVDLPEGRVQVAMDLGPTRGGDPAVHLQDPEAFGIEPRFPFPLEQGGEVPVALLRMVRERPVVLDQPGLLVRPDPEGAGRHRPVVVARARASGSGQRNCRRSRSTTNPRAAARASSAAPAGETHQRRSSDPARVIARSASRSTSAGSSSRTTISRVGVLPSASSSTWAHPTSSPSPVRRAATAARSTPAPRAAAASARSRPSLRPSTPRRAWCVGHQGPYLGEQVTGHRSPDVQHLCAPRPQATGILRPWPDPALRPVGPGW